MAQLRKRGLVTAVICSDPFLRLGQAQIDPAAQRAMAESKTSFSKNRPVSIS